MKTRIPVRSHQRHGMCCCLAVLASSLAVGEAASVVWFSIPDYFVSPGVSTYIAGEGFPHRTGVFVRRSGTVDSTVEVDLATSAVSAMPESDYTEITTRLVFRPGETGQTVLIPILDDTIAEPPERFRVTLSNPSEGATLGSPSNVWVQITDNDQGLQIEMPAYTVNEDAGAITIRVVRPDDGQVPVTVDFATADGTALAGVDYEETRGTLEFEPGVPLQQVVIPILNDLVHQPDRTFQLRLSNPSAEAVLGSPVYATVTITDTDEVVQFARPSLSVLEGAARLWASVVRGENASAASVTAFILGRTAKEGEDYLGSSQVIDFAPGEREKPLAIELLNDGLTEAPESFGVMLRGPSGGAILRSDFTLTVTIIDNDPGLGFEASEYAAWGKFPMVDVNVVRGSDGWSEAFTIDYYTFDQTALAGVDYEAASGTLEFGPNEQIKRIPIRLLRNPDGEPSSSFEVRLGNSSAPVSIIRNATSITIADVVSDGL